MKHKLLLKNFGLVLYPFLLVLLYISFNVYYNSFQSDFEYLFIVGILTLLFVFLSKLGFSRKDFIWFFSSVFLSTILLFIIVFNFPCSDGGMCGLLVLILLFEALFYYYLPLGVGLILYYIFRKKIKSKSKKSNI